MALLAAKAAGYTDVLLAGTLMRPYRITSPGPSRGVACPVAREASPPGGNVQVVSAPDEAHDAAAV